MSSLARFALIIGAAALFAGCGGQIVGPSTVFKAEQAHATARGFGTVFAMTRSGKVTVLHDFNGGAGDGSNPYAGLTDVNGTLYGTTQRGGTHNRGTVFEIAASGAETVLHNFAGSPDGSYPYAGLINVNGALYGTTLSGGAYEDGTVFAITPSGTETVLHSFKGWRHNDGAYPAAKLLDVDGTLYGTTKWGGYGSCEALYHERAIYGCGTVFKITTLGTETLLHSFDGAHGWTPIGGLINVDRTLYGTTALGVRGIGCGIVFKISTVGKESTVYNFPPGCQRGDEPEGDLLNINGTLYGTTASGGAADYGTVFTITTSGAESVIHSFHRNSGGGHPYASLLDIKGTLYGTTIFGDAN